MTMKTDKAHRSEIADAIEEMMRGARDAGVVPRTTITSERASASSRDRDTTPVTQISSVTRSGSDLGK